MSHNYVRYEELAAAQAAESGAPPRRCCGGLRRTLGWLFGAVIFEHRIIRLNHKRPTVRRYCRNVINNQKFSLLTFFPKVLYEQFKFFFNLYFLVVAGAALRSALLVCAGWLLWLSLVVCAGACSSYCFGVAVVCLRCGFWLPAAAVCQLSLLRLSFR
ncbi:hypothetical protein T492DRAFT_831962 [Pavlovales sp. CCMP2436]|nr:hypothetical protein T492DRAFT_831962 [Pavlovales sp. CCMP2436]